MTSPGHEHEVRPLVGEHRLEPLDHPRRLLGVGARADAEHVVGLGHAELLEEDLGHRAVVVLAGVDDDRRVGARSRSRGRAMTGAILTKFGRVPTT